MRHVSSLIRAGALFQCAARFSSLHLAGVRFCSGASQTPLAKAGAVDAVPVSLPYADLRTLLERVGKGDVSSPVPVAAGIPSFCESFAVRDEILRVYSVGCFLIGVILMLVRGRIVGMENSGDAFCSTVYSAPPSKPLASLVFVKGEYRIVVWIPFPLTNLPDGVRSGFTPGCCTVLHVGSIKSESIDNLAEAIASAIKNAPETLAERLQAHHNIVASERRLKGDLLSEDPLPIPACFFD